MHVHLSNQPAPWSPDLLIPHPHLQGPSLKPEEETQALPTLSISPPLSVIYVFGIHTQPPWRTRTNTPASLYAAHPTHQSSARFAHSRSSVNLWKAKWKHLICNWALCRCTHPLPSTTALGFCCSCCCRIKILVSQNEFCFVKINNARRAVFLYTPLKCIKQLGRRRLPFLGRFTL